MIDLLIIPISLGISGLIFFAIGIYLFMKYKYDKKGVKTTGTLIGFRKFQEYNINAARVISNNIEYKDYSNNVQNSKPILSFIADGKVITQCSEWSVSDLNRQDIGKQLPIKYYPINGGNSYRVILEGPQYEKQRKKGRIILFWVFSGIGIALIILAITVIFIYNFTV